MAVEFVGISEWKTDGGTSITMSASTGTSVDDLLIAYISKDDNVAISTGGSYGDWTPLYNNIANGASTLYIAWKWAEAGDANQSTSYTWNGDNEDWLGEIICYSGADTTTPIHASGIATGDSATQTAPSVAFTDLAAGSLVLQVMGIDSDDNDYVVPSQLTQRFNAIQANDIGGAGGDKSGKWTSPTGFNDPDSDWNTETAVYDENTSTYSSSDTMGGGLWTKYLELTHSAIYCSKVRFCSSLYVARQISLDVYYLGAWHNIYEGDFTSGWIEKEIGSIQEVTAMRAKIYSLPELEQALNEADFWEVIGGTGNTGTAVFGIPASNEWTAFTAVIEAAAVGGLSIKWNTKTISKFNTKTVNKWNTKD